MAFSIVQGDSPQLLILGSMPSQTSLERQQYYAHPRNAFWTIMSDLIGFEPTIDYPSKQQALCNAGIALWDVLYHCERAGSLDANIVKDSEQPNDFVSLFESSPTIKAIGFNGLAASKIFMRHHASCIEQFGLRHFCLPSTSPAHASITVAEKKLVWSAYLNPYLH